MNLLELLKSKKNKLQELQEKEETKETNDTINDEEVEIVIENHNSLFAGEDEILRIGAKELVKAKRADNYVEGIIVFGVMIRGLKYRRTETTEEGKTKIIFADLDLTNNNSKTL